MRALLDVHAFLWYANGDSRLPHRVRHWIADPANTGILSVVGAWEIIIKNAKGNLTFEKPVAEYLDEWIDSLLLERLPITFEHAYRVRSLESVHGDPFDRMLVAQALVENLPIITGDAAIRRYGVETIWGE